MSSGLQIEIELMMHPRRPEPLIRDVSMDVPSGSFVSLVGPSGAGKSTLLRIVSGLEKRFIGRVILDGQLVEGPSRAIQLVFQDYRLLPWKTVEENLGFAAPDSAPREESQRCVQHWLDKTRLDALRKNWPKDLSGGEEARVAFARAFIDPPKVLLLDEPFTGLDIGRRHELQEKLTEAVLANGTTVILVSHSVDDAVFLSDIVHVASSKPLTIIKTCSVESPRGSRDRFDPKLLAVAKEVTKHLLELAPTPQVLKAASAR
jgi:ABC-type nitrate/sulfonate/bicarbonate transport system ATPase subunit